MGSPIAWAAYCLSWASPHWACLGLMWAGPSPLCPQKASMGPAGACLQGGLSAPSSDAPAMFAYSITVTVHTAGRNEEHADEEVLQNNSL